ncbi:acetyl-CoA carboxylase biotin carboxylase subunit [Sphingobium nicotianae]|uniref:Acetyl-CoA carboxylase biotin carboxylase subunit n=1 Tax=Sphingobium nicotianae TaxID=2782607 RepID=A0A9X1DA28_9SPHN|nr:acetyl-CoA carboxylase biotin carboxylase subunit [Sphingobium nicotianae]
MTIRRILIANRGEIAVRIIRTAQRLGIETVLAVSEADRGSLGAQMADRALCIGPARPSESYLRVETIVQAALGSGCDAIHPGYGFLSERAALAQLCEDEGVIFIGPTARQIEAVGDKLRARTEAIAADVPVVPGGPVGSMSEAQALAAEIGAPILVKAVGGGGGRGMKLVERLEDLAATMDIASAEAGAAFGDARVYLERYVAQGRHVEVQVLGDGAGKVVHLGERDCSVQRRYQKLIEETPAPNLPEDIRAAMHEAAVRFAARLDYRGAGTVEFLYDVARRQFYFLEMNARIQVEHPVTEMVTGVDLVAEQIAIANGEGLRFAQEDIRIDGAAIEIRVNAEDPARDFMPSPGTVSAAHWPTGEGIRVDTHIVAGAKIPPYYDSMVAKIIAHGPDRATALDRLRAALRETRIEGVSTNIAFQAESLADPDFAAGGVDTGFLARKAAQAEV